MRLFWAVATLALVAVQLAADAGLVTPQKHSNCTLGVLCFVQDFNLVPFGLGEMCVGHFCNFDLAVEGSGCSHISSTQPINEKVALRI
jgi:hypothetical protein